MPFARDVVLQSPAFRTTQQNIMAYIQKQVLYDPARYNQKEHTEDYGEGQSICVVRVALHDMALPNMTVSIFIANVQWYLELLLENVCFHVVWLQNTAPMWKNDNDIPGGSPPHHRQTVQRVRAYDLAVHEMVSSGSNITRRNQNSTAELQNYVTFLDAFEASKEWTHADNIHLTSDWNRALGMFFLKLATKISG